MLISIIDSRPGMKITQNVFDRSGRVLLRAGNILTPQLIDHLRRRGVFVLEVEGEGEDFSFRPAPDPDIISRAVREQAENLVREIWEGVPRGKKIPVTAVRALVDKILEDLLERRCLICKLADIRALDDYTFTHSVNVCVMSLGIGLAKGFSRAALLDLGTGALLHDLGKVAIPPEILKKPGPLDPQEMAIVRTHPVHGYRLLAAEPEIPEKAALIAYEHHERFNGQGYPRGLKGDEVSQFAQLVAVIDVYDALTSDRVYRSKVLPYEAVEILIASSTTEFNPRYVRAFLEDMEIYPLGSIVELTNGDLGMVVAVNKALPIRPLLKRVVRRGRRLEVLEEEIDLMKETTLFVKRVVRFEGGAFRGGEG